MGRLGKRKDGKFVLLGLDGEERVLPCQLLERTSRRRHRGDSLRLVAFSDYRVQNIPSLIGFLKSQPRPDLILYAGDDIGRFHEGGTNFFEQLAEISNYGLCAVAGNDDKPEVRELITGRQVFSVHSCALVLGDFVIVGIEGAPMFPKGEGFDKSYNRGHLLYPEPILKLHMDRLTKKITAFARKKLIVISHTPPYGILDFAVRFGLRHIGSRPLRHFLESTPNVLLCVSGHVHSQGARSERCGDALVVNAASHDGSRDPGRVAIIDINGGVVSPPKWHEVWDDHSEQILLFSG